MDIQIMEGMDKSPRVIIECKEINDEILRLKAHIRLFHARLTAHTEGKTVFVDAVNALYFESVDDHTFVYTADAVMEVDYRLYELENLLPRQDFFRISKAQIVNIQHIKALCPAFNRTMLATLTNGEQVYISRKYSAELRKALSL